MKEGTIGKKKRNARGRDGGGWKGHTGMQGRIERHEQ